MLGTDRSTLAATNAMKALLAAVAAIGISFAANATPSVTLLAPRAGTVLEGGTETELAWSAASLPEHVEEWEAFLSLDGGKYYAVRITPHLDADRRSFRWRVPSVATSDARILIRVGDEHDELAIEFPQTFRIVPGRASLDIAEPHATVTDADGESALPAAPPIIEWVSGDRSGAGLATHRHRDRNDVDSVHVIADEGDIAAALLSSHSFLPRPRAAVHDVIRTEDAVPRAALPREPRPLLLLITRLNL
jgi:hypothetical protein